MYIMSKIDTKTILAKAKKQKARIKVTYTFDEDIAEAFKAWCDKNDAAQSRVLEELIKDLIGLK